MLMGAMTGFAIAKYTNNLILGFLGATVVGALIALIVAFGSITLKQSQVAIGFVLALLFTDLSSFLGNSVVRVPGLTVPSFKLPFLQDIPILGQLLFQSDLLVYTSYFLIIFTWFYFYRTNQGLLLRAQRHTAGYGWIALAIVIFGGWNPLRVALGAYLFGILQSLGSVAQSAIPDVPTQVFAVAPFALMILVLVLTSSAGLERILMPLPLVWRRAIAPTISTTPPAALGKIFEQD